MAGLKEVWGFLKRSGVEEKKTSKYAKFERDPPKDHPFQVWFNLVQGFQMRRFKCENLRRMTTDAKRWQKLTWPMAR